MVLELAVFLALGLSALAAAFGFLSWRAAGRPAETSPELLGQLTVLHGAMRSDGKDLRSEVRDSLVQLAATLRAPVVDLQTAQAAAAQALKSELTLAQARAAEQVEAATRRLESSQRERLELVAGQLKSVADTAAEEQRRSREALAAELAKLRAENATELDKMRATVDEKLQGTLDRRLDASFKQVSDRLESVQRGLGEMQTLTVGVGDLKRVLTNVKTRGSWGEVQLGALLEDSLTPEQYGAQVQVKPRSLERVDYAVRLPGHDAGGHVWLPIDCKFPHEDYARLVAAQEAADPVATEAAGKALERAVMAQAKALADKYICPPQTTDFAYMYLPTEGLFAEIVRRDGFTAELRARYKVEVAGPSTLTALLNSLRVGFKSLQIQKKSSEVWTELGRVKSAFEKYGDALQAVDKKLDEAKNKVSDVATRHGQVLKSLKNVEAVEVVEALDTPVKGRLILAEPTAEAA